MAFTPPVARNELPALPTPVVPAPLPTPPRAPVAQAAPDAPQAKTYEPTMAFFVSPTSAPSATTTPSAAPTPAPIDANEPKLAMTQLALLVAELTAFPDRSAATLSESGLDSKQWEREWGAWQRRFAEQPQERARYEPLVQYYTALRKPGGP